MKAAGEGLQPLGHLGQEAVPDRLTASLSKPPSLPLQFLVKPILCL